MKNLAGQTQYEHWLAADIELENTSEKHTLVWLRAGFILLIECIH